MADFKAALKALARGELKFDKVLSNLERMLRKKPGTADQLLSQLQEAYREGLVEAKTYVRLKDEIDLLSGRDTGLASADATQFADDSTEILSEEERQKIAEEAREMAAGKKGTEVSPVDLELSSPTGTSWPSGPTTAAPTAGAGGPAPQTIGPGTVLKERFRLDEVLGVGGMGTVYKGVDLLKVEARDKNPYVALKVLNEDFKKHPDSFIALQREASRQQKLAHPNIATVYDFDRTGETVFITMELLEGTPLNTFIKKEVRPKKGLPFEQAFPMIKGLGQALIYAHERHIVHSDFKPGNCFILKDGTMKVLDFGIARAVKNPTAGDAEKTLFDPAKLGALTPAYASAEMLEGKDPDPRDDIYALACVAYELLTGRHPFNKLPANTARDNKLVPAPVKGLKRRQMKALLKGLAFDREQRSQSVQEFLDELEGKTNLLRSPLFLGGVLLLVIAIASVVPLKNYLHQKELDQLIASFQTGDESVIAARLPELAQLPPADRQLVKGEVRKAIIDYFRNKAQRRLDGSEARYDYRGAQEIIAQARELYPDSATLTAIAAQIEESRNQLLSQMTEKFNQMLEQGRLLPDEQEEDLGDVLAVITEADPGNALLKDPRIPGAFASAISRARKSGDFELAQRLLETGLALAPDDVNLTNERDRIQADIEQAKRRARVAALADAILREGEPDSLEALQAQREPLLELAALEPGHQLLQGLRERLAPRITQDLSTRIQQQDWDGAGQLVDNYGELLRVLGLQPLIRQVDDGRRDFLAGLDRISAQLTAALAGQGSEAALPLLASLEQQAPGNPRTRAARRQVARALLSEARRQRAAGDLAAARATLERAGELAVEGKLGERLEQERERLARAEAAAADPALQERLLAQQQEQLAALEQDLRAQLASLRSDPDADPAPLLEILDGIEALAPDSPLLAEARQAVAEHYRGQADRLAGAGDFDNGIGLLRTALAELPGAGTLGEQMSELLARQAAAIAEAQARRIAQSKDRIDNLLARATLDPAWEQQLHDELAQLEPLLPEDDPWLADARRRIAEVYLARAAELTAQSSFARAQSMLDKAAAFTPGLDEIEAARQRIAQAEQRFERERREKERLARIEGLKQTLLAQARARKVTGARKTLEELRGELPKEDPFIARQAPEAIAGAYLKLAQSKAAAGDYPAALKLAQAGSRLAPWLAALKRAEHDYQVEVDLAAAGKALASEGELDSGQVRKWLEEVRRLAPNRFHASQDEFARQLAAHFERLKPQSPEKANSLLEDARELYPDHPAILALEPVPVAKPEPEKKPEQVAKVEREPRPARKAKGRECLARYAGYGRRKKGTCYDIVGGKARGPYLVVVPPGEGFDKPFAIGKYEISVYDYNVYCLLSKECAPIKKEKRLPLTGITLEQARAYTAWLSKVTGKRYRLPTAQEWIYAASAGGKQPKRDYNCRVMQGEKLIKGQSLLRINTGRPNGWGLYNYLGNAQEWVTGNNGVEVRGGAYTDPLSKCDISLAKPHDGSADPVTGFRVLQELG